MVSDARHGWGFSHLGQAHRTSQGEAPVKDARSPRIAVQFGSPAPRSAAPAASLTAASPAEGEPRPR